MITGFETFNELIICYEIEKSFRNKKKQVGKYSVPLTSTSLKLEILGYFAARVKNTRFLSFSYSFNPSHKISPKPNFLRTDIRKRWSKESKAFSLSFFFPEACNFSNVRYWSTCFPHKAIFYIGRLFGWQRRDDFF